MRNPLIQTGQPAGIPDFLSVEPEHVIPALEVLLQRYRDGVEKWMETAAPPTWEMVERELVWADDLGRAWSTVSHLKAVVDSPELREAYNAGLHLMTEHENWRQQHKGIYRAYQALHDSAEYSALSSVQKRIVELELRDFRLEGVALPEEQQASYRKLVMRLSKLGAKFDENLLDATHAWTLHLPDSNRLAGLPEAELNMLAGLASEHGEDGWLIDLGFPSFNAIMTHAEDRELRKEVYRAYVTRASEQGVTDQQLDNAPLIAEILSLRYQLARLLGFDEYVKYALSRRMAESPAVVLSFLQGLAEKAVPAARQQFAELSAFAEAGGAVLPLEAWDVSFWSERYRQVELNLSDEVLKPYFPLSHMLDALFFTAGRLFGIKMELDEEVSGWHEDVRFYWLQDESGQRFAGLYMDLFTRKGKRGGAWMDVCLSRRKLEHGIQVPVAYLICNFAAPVGDQPCLMTHHDVETLFHEFGHSLHHMLTEIDWPQVNGISNVEWDAVELPSQLLENWCWEETIMARYAAHYKTGEAMPEDLKMRLLRSRHFQKAIFLVRQLEYAITDIRLHLEYDPVNPIEARALLTEVREPLAVISLPEWNRFLNGFSHIFGGGYAAGYYSYLWAEQLAAGAWQRFRAEGPFNADTGKALRDEILAMGASRPVMDSFVAFHGSPPDPKPLLESYGL